MDPSSRSLSPTRRPLANDGRPTSLPQVPQPGSLPPSAPQLLPSTQPALQSPNLGTVPPNPGLQQHSFYPKAVSLAPNVQQSQPQMSLQAPQTSASLRPTPEVVRPFQQSQNVMPSSDRVLPRSEAPANYGAAKQPSVPAPRAAREPVRVQPRLQNDTPITPQEGTPLKPDGQISLLRDPGAFLGKLASVFSWRLLLMIVVAQHVLKGTVAGGGDEGFVGTPIFFLLKAPPLELEGGELQVVKACMIAPWALRPIIGIMSDSVPIFGYRRLPYMVITSVVSVFASLAIGLNFATTSVTALLICAFLIFLQVSTIDLLVKARSSELVKEYPSIGPEFMQFQWIGTNIGQIVGMLLVGLILQFNSPRIPYLVAAPFCALVLWPVVGNYLGERKIDPNDPVAPLSGRDLRSQGRTCLIVLTLLHGLCVLLIMALVYLMLCKVLSQAQVWWTCIAVVVFLLSSFALFLRWEIGAALVFWFLWSLSFFSIDGALFYFYTNESDKYPNGPHFSTFFYTAGIGLASLFGVLIGYVTGTPIFKSWGYRSIIVLTTSLRSGARLLLIPMLLRWTHDAFGTGEFVWVMVVIGFDALCCAWCWIPKEVMMAHLAPRGAEAMVMSLFVGACVFAEIIGGFAGNYLLRLLDIRPCGKKEDALAFDKLWQAQAWTALSPLVVLLLVPICIPSRKQTDELLLDEVDSANHNSLWERFRRR